MECMRGKHLLTKRGYAEQQDRNITKSHKSIFRYVILDSGHGAKPFVDL